MGCAAVAALRLGIAANGRIPAEYYQAMFWGMGHSFRYVNVAAMVVAWYLLIGIFLGEPRINQKVAKGLLALFALFPLATPVPYFLYDPLSVPTRKAWSIALDSGLGLPVILLGPMILIWVWRAARAKHTNPQTGSEAERGASPLLSWNDPRVMAFVFSAALFALGLSIHPAARQGTLRTPAHYHGVIVGGVMLAFMGLAYHLLKPVNRKVVWRRAAAIQPYLFAPGVMLMVFGLLGAGDLGAPRKTYDVAVTGVAWLRPMVVMGIGAGIAAAGGALFVAVMLRSLLRRPRAIRSVVNEPALAGAGGD